jgi:ABC-type Mn2+/Zn2+ transport system ATPase subunit
MTPARPQWQADRTGPAIELAGVSAGYGGPAVLRDLTFTIDRGELVGAVGPSGSGKTTLLRVLTGRADRYAGDVHVLGQEVPGGGRRRRTPRIGYVPQLGAVDWDFPLTVEQVVLLGLTDESTPAPWFRRDEKRRARRLLDRLGIGDLARRHIGELSGGQRQRMFLARAMVRDVDIVLLDEPTSGVDLQTRHDILHLLGELNEQGLTVLLTTHDLNWVAGHLPRVICLNEHVVADGPPGQVFTPETLRRTYAAEVRILEHGDLVVVVDRGAVLPRPGRASAEDHVHTGPVPHGDEPDHPHTDLDHHEEAAEGETARERDPRDVLGPR